MWPPTSQPKSYQQHLKRSLHPSLQAPIVKYTVGSNWDTSATPFEAAQKAAMLISELHKGPVHIPLSGGVDSEAMARSFIAAGIPIIPVITKFENGFNEFDTVWAEEFCDSFKLQPKILNLDVEDFFETGSHLVYASEYGCRSPQLATHLWLADQIVEPLIFPYNPLPLLQTPENKIYISFPPDLYLCYDRYFEKTKKPGLGLFFLYTPELIYSFFKLELYSEMLFDYDRFCMKYSPNLYLIKCELYRAGGFDVIPRGEKATGFELFRKYLNKKHNFESSDYFDEKFRRPMEEMVKDPKLISIGDVDLKSLYEKWIDI